MSVFKLPWKEILKYTTVAFEMAKSVKESLGRHEPAPPRGQGPALSEVVARLSTVERGAADQAELLAKLASHLETLSSALRAVSIRIAIAMGLALAALLIALAGLFIR